MKILKESFENYINNRNTEENSGHSSEFTFPPYEIFTDKNFQGYTNVPYEKMTSTCLEYGMIIHEKPSRSMNKKILVKYSEDLKCPLSIIFDNNLFNRKIWIPCGTEIEVEQIEEEKNIFGPSNIIKIVILKNEKIFEIFLTDETKNLPNTNTINKTIPFNDYFNLSENNLKQICETLNLNEYISMFSPNDIDNEKNSIINIESSYVPEIENDSYVEKLVKKQISLEEFTKFFIAKFIMPIRGYKTFLINNKTENLETNIRNPSSKEINSLITLSLDNYKNIILCIFLNFKIKFLMKEIVNEYTCISEKSTVSEFKDFLNKYVEDIRFLLPSEIIYVLEKFLEKKVEN